MKAKNIIHWTLMGAMMLTMGSCQLFNKKEKAKTTTKPTVVTTADGQSLLSRVNENAQTAKFITSKLKFTVQVGEQNLTLTGNLKMKRDDVIRLQLMAFGFVEAGRVEFTKNYVLIIDRINKQYIKAPYEALEFMRNTGLNFNSIQALFWNELFMPGHTTVSDVLGSFSTNMEEDDGVISYDLENMSYRWLADKLDGRIKMTNILYKNRFKGNSQLNWDYENFKTFDHKPFPTSMAVTLTLPKKTINIGIVLSYLGKESEWETRTNVSNKYSEVSIDQILQRFMAL